MNQFPTGVFIRLFSGKNRRRNLCFLSIAFFIQNPVVSVPLSRYPITFEATKLCKNVCEDAEKETEKNWKLDIDCILFSLFKFGTGYSYGYYKLNYILTLKLKEGLSISHIFDHLPVYNFRSTKIRFAFIDLSFSLLTH